MLDSGLNVGDVHASRGRDDVLRVRSPSDAHNRENAFAFDTSRYPLCFISGPNQLVPSKSSTAIATGTNRLTSESSSTAVKR